MQPRQVLEEGVQVMDFATYLAFVVLAADRQAEIVHRLQADAERAADTQAPAEATRLAKDLE